jgi:2-polyprenyl-6-methoxyphenol hydroxylase-like FAD-dependent oxidoreductase
MTRVAIIGGGIGGLTAANALSRAGIETAVYEAAAELREIGAGVALHPNAMKVLRAPVRTGPAGSVGQAAEAHRTGVACWGSLAWFRGACTTVRSG